MYAIGISTASSANIANNLRNMGICICIQIVGTSALVVSNKYQDTIVHTFIFVINKKYRYNVPGTGNTSCIKMHMHTDLQLYFTGAVYNLYLLKSDKKHTSTTVLIPGNIST